ncbi:hypothetical protein EDB92DRAFT_1885486 [Lactarius akahatsu]|uniref:Uncharacterized protein n=1 Tax=Lactarius akahatsu TaxID=416441 RepID=A0AAD4Q509_9AGAM|nr:hypothetical protein EDB92DRAFT_1885486 [Lactarius akahatsu]
MWPSSTRPRAHKMTVVSSLATGRSVAPLNVRISSSHCSPSASSSSLDDWIKLMRRLLTRNRNEENWSQTWAIEDNCQSNCLHDICNRSGVKVLELKKKMDIASADIWTSARPSGVCIPVRSMNRPSYKASIVGWLNNVILISPRPGASILATRLSRYLLDPRYLRNVRAGRTMRSPDGGGKLR